MKRKNWNLDQNAFFARNNSLRAQAHQNLFKGSDRITETHIPYRLEGTSFLLRVIQECEL